MKTILKVYFTLSFLLSLIHPTATAQVSQDDKRFEHSGLVQVTVTSMKGVPKQGERILFAGTKHPDWLFEGISDIKGKFDVWLKKGDIYQIKIEGIGETTDFSTIEVPNKPGAFKGKYQIQFELPVSVTLDDVLFETGSSVIQPSSFKSLDALAALLKRKEQLVIMVVGHTDDRGNREANEVLSTKRAEAVKQYLLKKSGAIGRVKSEGKGDSEPVADNSTDEGRKLNRRTEIRVLQE